MRCGVSKRARAGARAGELGGWRRHPQWRGATRGCTSCGTCSWRGRAGRGKAAGNAGCSAKPRPARLCPPPKRSGAWGCCRVSSPPPATRCYPRLFFCQDCPTHLPTHQLIHPARSPVAFSRPRACRNPHLSPLPRALPPPPNKNTHHPSPQKQFRAHTRAQDATNTTDTSADNTTDTSSSGSSSKYTFTDLDKVRDARSLWWVRIRSSGVGWWGKGGM